MREGVLESCLHLCRLSRFCAIFGKRKDSAWIVCWGVLLSHWLVLGADTNIPVRTCDTYSRALLFRSHPFPTALLPLFDKTEITRQRRVSSHYTAVVSEQKDAGSSPAISYPLFAE